MAMLMGIGIYRIQSRDPQFAEVWALREGLKITVLRKLRRSSSKVGLSPLYQIFLALVR